MLLSYSKLFLQTVPENVAVVSVHRDIVPEQAHVTVFIKQG